MVMVVGAARSIPMGVDGGGLHLVRTIAKLCLGLYAVIDVQVVKKDKSLT